MGEMKDGERQLHETRSPAMTVGLTRNKPRVTEVSWCECFWCMASTGGVVAVAALNRECEVV